MISTTHTIRVGSLIRSYDLVTTNTKRPPSGWPLILAYHGGLGNAKQFAQQSDLVAKAPGYAIAFVNGTGRAGKLTFNAVTCCGGALAADVDELAAFDAILADVKRETRIDARRVYLMGYSNGAMLAHWLAAKRGGQIAAIGVVAGDVPDLDVVPVRGVAVRGFAGALDRHVPPGGGVGPDAMDRCAHHSVDETVRYWRGAGSVVEYEIVPGLGHQIPGGLPVDGLGPWLAKPDAMGECVRFFGGVKL